MTNQQAISSVQQLSDQLSDGDPITFYAAFKERLDLVLQLACIGAGVGYPQTGYRGAIVYDDAEARDAA